MGLLNPGARAGLLFLAIGSPTLSRLEEFFGFPTVTALLWARRRPRSRLPWGTQKREPRGRTGSSDGPVWGWLIDGCLKK